MTIVHPAAKAASIAAAKAAATSSNLFSALEAAFNNPVLPEDFRRYGACRVYVGITSEDKNHVKAVAATCKALGKIFEKKNHYGTRNVIYVGYDNFDGRALARGTAIVAALKAEGIEARRDEHGD
jgi:hypothetical protein